MYEKNIAVLRETDPQTAEWVDAATAPQMPTVVEAKSGHPVPKLGDIMLHSGYHPEKEAEKFATEAQVKRGDTAVVFGFGFGYHIEALAATGARVIAIEPSAGMIKAALSARDLSGLLETVRIVPPERFEPLAAALDYTSSVFLDHEPSVRLAFRLRDGVAEPFLARTIAARRRYRIMVVGPVYGGTTTTAVSAVRALEALGFDVDFVDNTIHNAERTAIGAITPDQDRRASLHSRFSDYLGELAIARAQFVQPDIILALAQAPLSGETIDRLKGLGVPVVFWFVEDYGALPYWRAVAPHYDYFFCIQKGAFVEKLAGAGAGAAFYLPQAADHTVHRPLELTAGERETYGSPVSFMGAGYTNRQSFFAGLLEMPLKLWGTEWNLATPLGQRVANRNRRLDPEEYVKIFNASAINLNLHSSTTHQGVDPVGDFVNPRTFEIAACGGFQLVDERGYLPEMFDADDEIVTFRDIDDLREKIAYYLDHPGERGRIAEAARRRVMTEHTFIHRMARLITIVAAAEDERIERARAARRGVNDVDAIIERTGKPELKAFLARFEGQGKLSLPNVMKAIEKGDGPLSRSEAIFVMIDQIVTQGPGAGGEWS